MALITCKDVAVGYEGEAVCSGITASINRGDYLCIIGENGAGKSTFVKTLVGLLRPLAGHIAFGNSGDSFSTRGARAPRVGYLSQRTQAQKDFPASVQEVVYSGFDGASKLRPFRTAEEKNRARQALRRTGVENLIKRRFGSLSGGQQQRVLLARALCASDELLVLDEPVAGLDPQATEGFYQLLSALNKENETTIIMVSHDLGNALEFATHVLLVSKQPRFDLRDNFDFTQKGDVKWTGQ